MILDEDSGLLAPGTGEASDYLLGLLQHESIGLYRYADGGPPAGTERTSNPWTDAAVGWIEVLPDDAGLVYSTDTGIMRSTLRINDIAELVRVHGDNSGQAKTVRPVAAETRVNDIRLLKVAGAANVDLLITDRPYLLSDPFHIVSRGVTEVALLADALPIVGLYLRTQGHYLADATPDGKFHARYSRGLMTWVASRALLPEGWRSMTACVQHSIHNGDDTLTHYAGTAHHRLERAIAARDLLFLALNQPQNNDTADEALTAFDSILINLDATLDVTARVCNVVLGMPLQPQQVGWRRPAWLKVVRSDATMGNMVDRAAFRQLMTIVGELRNTIHGAALDPLAVSRASIEREDTLVGLPRENIHKLLGAMDALGGRTLWGVQEVIPNRAHADLDILCERLMIEVPKVVNDIMRLTDVEKLPGVALSHGDHGPDESPRSPFNARARRNILLQYGLTAPM